MYCASVASFKAIAKQHLFSKNPDFFQFNMKWGTDAFGVVVF
jgi:hypothetical protein